MKHALILLALILSFSGFVDERSPASSKPSGKASSDLKSGKKKVSFESLKTGKKTSFETPAAKGMNFPLILVYQMHACFTW